MGGDNSRGSPDHGHAHGSSGNLRTAFLLNLTFVIIEVIGELYTNSIAILSDAAHDLDDSMSLGFAWYFDRLSRRGRTAKNNLWISPVLAPRWTDFRIGSHRRSRVCALERCITVVCCRRIQCTRNDGISDYGMGLPLALGAASSRR